MEEIIGPVHGFHLACYTIPTTDGHFGYAKVCFSRPDSVWDTGFAVRKIAAGPYAEPADALVAVITKSQQRLSRRQADGRMF